MLMIPMVLQEQENGHGVTLDIPNKQLGRDALDHHREIRMPEGWNGRDHEEQGMVAKLPSGVVPRHTFNDDQLGEGACYGRYGSSDGECWCLATCFPLISSVPGRSWGDMVPGPAAISVDVMKGAADGFGPLKTILGAISAVYTDHKVCSEFSGQNSSVANPPVGRTCYWEQDQKPSLTSKHTGSMFCNMPKQCGGAEGPE